MKTTNPVEAAIEQLETASKSRIATIVEEHRRTNARLREQEKLMGETRIKSTELWMEAKTLFSGIKALRGGLESSVKDQTLLTLMKTLDAQESEPREYTLSSR